MKKVSYISNKSENFIHLSSLAETLDIGCGSYVWQFSVVMDEVKIATYVRTVS